MALFLYLSLVLCMPNSLSLTRFFFWPFLSLSPIIVVFCSFYLLSSSLIFLRQFIAWQQIMIPHPSFTLFLFSLFSQLQSSPLFSSNFPLFPLPSLTLSSAGSDSEFLSPFFLSAFSFLLPPPLPSPLPPPLYFSDPVLSQAGTLLSNDLDRQWLLRGDRPVIRQSNPARECNALPVFHLYLFPHSWPGGRGADIAWMLRWRVESTWLNHICLLES